jgi:hypothetical protein
MLVQHKEMPNLNISGNKVVNNEAGKVSASFQAL